MAVWRRFLRSLSHNLRTAWGSVLRWDEVGIAGECGGAGGGVVLERLPKRLRLSEQAEKWHNSLPELILKNWPN